MYNLSAVFTFGRHGEALFWARVMGSWGSRSAFVGAGCYAIIRDQIGDDGEGDDSNPLHLMLEF